MNFVLIGLRSNLMQGLKPLEDWSRWAQKTYGDLQLSNIYRTEGQALKQGWLSELWAVARVETEHSHYDSASFLLKESDGSVEATLLSWGNEVFLNPETPLPNPDLHRQRVFLQCCAEIEPKLVHPILGQSLIELVNLDTRPLNADFYAQGRRTLSPPQGKG